MALLVECPNCRNRYQVANDLAGKTGTCPACGTVARIPAPDSSPEGATGDSWPGGYSPYASSQFPAEPHPPGYGDPAQRRQAAIERMQTHLVLVPLFDVIVGVLSLLWCLYMLLEAHLLSTGVIPIPRGPGQPSRELVTGICLVLAALALVTAVVQIMVGIALFRRTPRCRIWGIVSGVISCAAVWQCCAFVFCLPIGIYSLVVLFSSDAREVLGP